MYNIAAQNEAYSVSANFNSLQGPASSPDRCFPPSFSSSCPPCSSPWPSPYSLCRWCRDPVGRARWSPVGSLPSHCSLFSCTSQLCLYYRVLHTLFDKKRAPEREQPEQKKNLAEAHVRDSPTKHTTSPTWQMGCNGPIKASFYMSNSPSQIAGCFKIQSPRPKREMRSSLRNKNRSTVHSKKKLCVMFSHCTIAVFPLLLVLFWWSYPALI